jgi:cyanophycinase
VITNASGGPGDYQGPAFAELGRRVPDGSVTCLHLLDIDDANDLLKIAPLLEADGLFFTGGRQWRIAEVYLNTRAHAAMNALLERGGVIGGTSAGASIQGSFLWRGDTRGAEYTVGDHTQGLGFMKLTAIDQHLLVRGRETDLLPFIQAAPEYIGIGVDESTAALVERDSLTVLGASYVAIYRPGQSSAQFLRVGEGCNLSHPGASGSESAISAPESADLGPSGSDNGISAPEPAVFGPSGSENTLIAPETAAPAPPQPLDGYPIANFAVTANVSADGDLFGRILHNRGKLGQWLTDLGGLRLTIRKGTGGMAEGSPTGPVSYPLSSFTQREVRRAFPFVTATLKDHPAIHSEIKYTAWAPLGLDDLDVTTLPVLQLELTLTNPTDIPDTLQLFWRADTLGHSPSPKHDFSALTEMEQSVVIPPQGSETLRYALALYDERDYAALRFHSQEEIEDYVCAHWDALKQATEAFEKQIPHTGDPELDDILRWYMVPGVALTKCTNKEKVVTLGYCELNQRDSYWASWLHLVMMPTAERTMIEESIGGMRPSGKIPTCILPRIDRKDDIDINAFFLLRFFRYYRYTQDRAFLETHWDALRQAADWLLGRDLEGTGLPMQTSTWADWKDVSGVEGRQYSPYACLVYIAAMRRMATMATDLEDGEAQAKYGDAAAKAYDRINLPREQGGLWNGRYYCQQWNDGRSDDRLLQDQTVGILFDVIPRGRAKSIIRALNRNSRTPWGIAETWPYYDAGFGYEPGTYHNGGVWPWLSFVDDWGRLKLGRRREAINLVKTVARADLADSGDWAANEHLDSRTGENLGFQLQGWNAGLFGLVRFGLGETDFEF